MNKKLVMWGTFVLVFLLSIVGSYKFINRNSQNMTIEMAAPSLPLVQMVVGGERYNTLYGYTSEMITSEVATCMYPLKEDRVLHGSISTFSENVKEIRYEVRNQDGSRLIESGTTKWEETAPHTLSFQVPVKDLIEPGEEYLFTVMLDTEQKKDIRYYTRFVFADDYDIENQIAFVKEFHEMTFDKQSVTKIASYMEPDKSANNSSLAHVNVHSAARQVVWDALKVEPVTEPELQITYLQDNYGGYTLDYYATATVDERTEYYHVVEHYLISSYGDKIYLLDYERTADTIFHYEENLYNNDKINLSIQSKEIPLMESDDGNMAAFVVNSTLYYYDDVENDINLVYGFFENANADVRSKHFEHDIKILSVDGTGSIYFAVYGYMNRGNYEGKTGIALYSYDGQSKLLEEIGFYESAHSALYVMQEVETLSFLSRNGVFYFVVDGNVVSYDLMNRTIETIGAYGAYDKLFVSDDHSAIVIEEEHDATFWYLETGYTRPISVTEGSDVIPLGFIGNDFVYGLFEKQNEFVNSDGTYSRYMKELRIQSAQGEVLKQYHAGEQYISGCSIKDNQIVIELLTIVDGKVIATSEEQIVANKNSGNRYNGIDSALTNTYQTIWQVQLKNKIDLNTLEHKRAKEAFGESSSKIFIDLETQKPYYTVYSPWGATEYTTEPGEAMVKAQALEGYALDETGASLWRKASTVTKNQIMAIELEEETRDRTSKEICLDIMLRQIGAPKDVAAELREGKSCQEILSAEGDYVFMDVTGSSLESLLYYTNQDIPIMVLYEDGTAILITGFNQFNIVVMDPVKGKLGYMARSDAKEMLAESNNQVFTYYKLHTN